MTQPATKEGTKHSAGLQSMQSLGWGAVAMQQLSELINWTGSDKFQPVRVDPWTALVTITSDPAPLEASPAQSASPPPSETTQAVEDTSQAEQLAAEQLAAEKLAAEKLAAEKLAAEKLAAEKLAAEKLASEKLAAEKLASEELADEKLAAEKLAAEKLAAEKLAAEKLAAEKLAAEKVATEKAADQKLADQKLADQKLADQRLVDQRLADEKLAAEKLKAELAQREQRKAEQREAEQREVEQREVEQREVRSTNHTARTTGKPSRAVADVAAIPTLEQTRIAAIQRPSAADNSLETYLARLEQLVLQLNMELGRRDQASSDPIQDLSQRVIDLNLENLALKEQLRQSLGHRHE